MAELSPAAQAVLDAVCDNTNPDCDTQHIIAAALRAASYIPSASAPVPLARRLRAIADELELEANTNTTEDQ
jgi:hypothetical protein